MNKVKKFMYGAPTHPNAIVPNQANVMILEVQSDAY